MESPKGWNEERNTGTELRNGTKEHRIVGNNHFMVANHHFMVAKACHGDMVRDRLARTYASREGDMSW